MPVPSVISEGNAKGAARTHAHTQKRARRQNSPSMASTAAEGPLEPQPGPTETPYPHEAASSHDHKGHNISALFPCGTQGSNCPHINKVSFRTKELTCD